MTSASNLSYLLATFTILQNKRKDTKRPLFFIGIKIILVSVSFFFKYATPSQMSELKYDLFEEVHNHINTFLHVLLLYFCISHLLLF